MKQYQTGMPMPQEKNELKDLFTEVKETIFAGELENGSNKIFAAVDLWNCHKRQRTTAQMRRRLN